MSLCRITRRLAVVVLPAAALLLAGCAQHRVVRSSSLDFLYPKGAEPVAGSDVTLKIPVRVGLAFAPSGGQTGGYLEPLSEAQRARERTP